MLSFYRFGEFELDVKEEILSRDGKILPINRRAFQVLLQLVERAGETVTKEEFFEAVWDNAFVEENNLSVAAAALRKALDDDPKQPRFIATVPRKGYKFVGEVTIAAENVAVASASTLASEETLVDPAESERSNPQNIGASTAATPSFFRTRKILVVAVGFGVLLVLIATGFKYFGPTTFSGSVSNAFPSAKPAYESIAVLPFKYAELDDEYLADGFTESLTSELSRMQGIRVIGQDSASKFKGDDVNLGEAAEKLNVQALLTGKFRRENDRIVLSIELTKTDGVASVWRADYDLAENNAGNVQSMLFRDVAATLRLPFEHTRPEPPKPDPQAYLLYLKAKYYWNRRSDGSSTNSFDKPIDLYKQALDIDPTFARAYVGIANVYSQANNSKYVPKTIQQRFEIVNGYLAKALEIDPGLSDAHATMGLTDLYLSHRPQWQKAEDSFRRALAIDPNNANARHWLAEYLALTGRYDESLAEYDRAIAVEPLSMAVRGDRCYAIWFSGRVNEAVTCMEAVREMDPTFKRTYWYLFGIYITANRFADAVEVFRLIENETPAYRPFAEEDYAAFKKALKMADPQAEFWKVYFHIFTRDKSEWLLAFAYAQTGENDKAFAELDKVIEAGGGILAYLPSLPLYKPLHNDIRWKVIRTRVGLDQ